jgi:hypothetical protein
MLKLCARCGTNQTTTKYCKPCRPKAYEESRGPEAKRLRRQREYRNRRMKRLHGPEWVPPARRAFVGPPRSLMTPQRRSQIRKARYAADPGYRVKVAEYSRLWSREREGGTERIVRKKDGLLLECTRCRKMLPRGWFTRDGRGEDSRRSHCRTCRKPEKSTDAARRRALGAKPLPPESVRILWKRQRGLCGICYRPMPPTTFEIDHIVPLALGGPHEMGNLQLAHKQCNRKKGAKAPHEFMRAQGFLL